MMMAPLRNSWILHTLAGRLALLAATLIVLLGLAGGTIYALSTALDAEHQSQAICGLAGDVAKTPIVDVTPPVGRTGLSFIKDARNAYRVGNCQKIQGPLPSPAPPLVSAYPGIK